MKKNWVEINDDACGTYNTNSRIKVKTAMVKTILCYYTYAYIHFKGNISVANIIVASAGTNNANKKVIFQNCAPFTDWISEISYTLSYKEIMLKTLM